LIAEHGHFDFPTVTGAAFNKPLFYVLEGELWRLIGYSDVSGRLLCAVFGGILIVSLVVIAAARSWRRFAISLACLFVLAVPVFAIQIVSTLTDVVVAAMVALTGALLYVGRGAASIRWTALFCAAALAVLAKPNAIPALAGIALSQFLGDGTLRQRIVRRVLPIVAGGAVAFTYYVVQAHQLRLGLRPFLESGVTGPYYSHLADTLRRSAILDFGWFGDTLRTVLLFSLVYAGLRLARVAHRPAVALSAAAAAVLSWLLPWIGAGEARFAVGAFSGAAAVVSWAVASAVLAAGAWAPRDAIPTARELAQLCLWVAPPFVAWAVFATYDLRFLTPAWPGLLALMTIASLPAMAALARVHLMPLLPIVGLAAAVALNAYNLDGLGRAGWDQWRRTPSSHRLELETTRSIVLPALTRALAAARPLMGDGARLFSPEGAFRFFFPGRVEQSFPVNCSDVRDYRVLVLTTDQGSKNYMEQFLHVSDDPAHWAACPSPHLTELTDGSEGYAVFAIRR
jgi:4-amino-4-deoxy-L-arabinose transferase-like glycosyltransferase